MDSPIPQTNDSPARASLTFLSPIGCLRVSASGEKLVEIKLGAPPAPEVEGDSGSAADEVCRLARAEIEAYLRGELEHFTVPYRLIGSSFQRSVWKEMVRIPLGSTATYGRLARRLGDPGASRAVGVACGANPIPLIVPCHRVVASNGMGGFSGGLKRKEWLLKLELTGRVPPALDADAEMDGERSEPEQSPGSSAAGQQSLF